MHVFLSDIHFGRSDYETEREVERDLLAFLRAVRPNVERLFLVGDIFEHFVEYRHSIPKGFARFMGLLADWTDAGIPVIYHIGNHDPWHRDYFESELGVTVVEDDSFEELSGLSVYITHGDGLGEGAGPYKWLKPILRHPVPVWLYTSVLPSDLGLGIAKWYSRTFRSGELNPQRVVALRNVAREILAREEADVVVMGHSHMPELTRFGKGVYLNPGSWFEDRSVAIIDNGETSIKKWNGSSLQPYSQVRVEDNGNG